jgi:uncharacterized protein YdhG (YjbR/CyaY superfamily)
MTTTKPESIDDYISGFPEDVQHLLTQVRETVRQEAPDAEETISYAMPTFRYAGKVLVHFAAFKNHIGFYATPSGHTGFEEELSAYKSGKGSVQFPIDQPMPLELIARIVRFRVGENREQAAKKKRK